MDRHRFLKVREFLFDPKKSAWLKEERGVGFEEIIDLLGQEELVDVFPHPNAKYRHQFICELVVDEYVYVIPFIVDGSKVFLKTLFPSRKATKHRRKRR